MSEEEGADLLAQTDPKEMNLEPILPQFTAAVKRHDLKSALNILALLPKEAVELLNQSFPSFDKTVLSKCSNPEKYGCVFHPDGYAALRTLIKEEDESMQEQQDHQKPCKRRKSSTHKFTCRVAGRLPDDKYRALQRYLRIDGYKTMQDWVTAQVDSYIKEMEAKYGE